MVKYEPILLTRMSRSRGEDGRYVKKTSLNDVLVVLNEHDDPVTGKEVGDALGISNRSALDKLNELHEDEAVERKKVGAGAVVWWLADEQPSPMPDAETAADRLDGFGLFSGEEGEAFAEAVEASREQFDEDYKERQRDLFGQ
jgi:predicted ArsR family transcriptional regulator